MATYDGEDMLDDILKIMTDNSALNSRIAAIENEKSLKGKGLDPALQPIKDFHIQTWTDKVLQATPAIFFGIENTESDSVGPVTANTYKVFIEVIALDNGQTNDVWKRISRYSRALRELFEESFASSVACGKTKIDSVRPVAFKLELDSDVEVKVGGISITVPIV